MPDLLTKEIEIFRIGSHTASNGSRIDFSVQDLQEIANSYQPDRFRASLVCGHPKDDDPSWGIVQSLRVVGDRLKATVEKIAPEFVEWVRNGRYHSISPSFYLRESASNPTPGKLHLKHIGALGAVPPAVKGLEPLSMCEPGEVAFAEIFDAIEFQDFTNNDESDPIDVAQALFRNIREFLISEYDTDTADRVLPNDLIAQLDDDDDTEYAPLDLVRNMNDRLWETQSVQQAQSSYNEEPTPNPDRTMTEEELNAAIAQLNADRESHAARENAISERETQAAQYSEQLRVRDINNQIDALITDGRVLPAEKQKLVAFMQALPESEIEFGEEKESPIAAFVSLLKNRPSLVPQGEVVTDAAFSETIPQSTVKTPHGVEFDPESEKLDQRVRKHMKEQGVSYAEAVHELGITFGG